MKAILNYQIIEYEKLSLSSQNRGFSYGDGFFETIAFIAGRPRFLRAHLQRLTQAAKLLQLDTRNLLDQELVEKDVQTLQELNSVRADGRLKIYLWREAPGLYVPSDNNTARLITLEPREPIANTSFCIAGFSEQVVNFATPFSQFKTLSALKYVLAGLEKKTKELDEIILLDHEGNISETLYANIWWVKDKHYFTAPLSTGCVDGVMKNWLREQLKPLGRIVVEKKIKKDELLSADCIFTTNASGIRHIRQIGEILFQVDGTVNELLTD